MKKLILCVLTIALFYALTIPCAFADDDEGYDFSDWDDEQILFLLSQVNDEVNRRGLALPTPAPASTQINPVIVVGNTTTPKEDAEEITFDTPIVILDNDYTKITINGKYAGIDKSTKKEVYGYNTVIENKMLDKYINVHLHTINIDGFMLDRQAGFYGTVETFAPKAKANAKCYLYLDRVESVELTSLDDLKNVTGQVQIMFSDDGSSYSGATGPNGEFPFDNNFAFEKTIP